MKFLTIATGILLFSQTQSERILTYTNDYYGSAPSTGTGYVTVSTTGSSSYGSGQMSGSSYGSGLNQGSASSLSSGITSMGGSSYNQQINSGQNMGISYNTGVPTNSMTQQIVAPPTTVNNYIQGGSNYV